MVTNVACRQEQKKADVAEYLWVFRHVGFFCSWRHATLVTKREAPRGRNNFAGQGTNPVFLGRVDMLGTILLVLLVLMLLGSVGTLPNWSHSRSWGYGPSGGMGLIVVILLVLLLFRGF